MPSPRATKALELQLESVSCSSYDACTAVGSYENPSGLLVGVVERRTGGTWSLQATPKQGAQEQIVGVSCPTATSCTAVGDVGVGAPGFIEHWDGSAWKTQLPATVNAPHFYYLTAVSCPSAVWCTVVGGYADGPYVSDMTAAAGTWDGSSWKFSLTGGGQGQELLAVSCASLGDCTTVGPGNAGFIQMGAGAKWVYYPGAGTKAVSAHAPLVFLSGVSCVSPTLCMAVGQDYFVRWNGSTWSGHTIPTP